MTEEEVTIRLTFIFLLQSGDPAWSDFFRACSRAEIEKADTVDPTALIADRLHGWSQGGIGEGRGDVGYLSACTGGESEHLTVDLTVSKTSQQVPTRPPGTDARELLFRTREERVADWAVWSDSDDENSATPVKASPFKRIDSTSAKQATRAGEGAQRPVTPVMPRTPKTPATGSRPRHAASGGERTASPPETTSTQEQKIEEVVAKCMAGHGGTKPRKPFYSKWQGVDPATIIGVDTSVQETLPRNRTGLVYDERMALHLCTQDFHPEQPLRLVAVLAMLAEQGLAQKCLWVPARMATHAELKSVHKAQHVLDMCNLGTQSQDQLNGLSATLDSVYLCRESGMAAQLASGSVIEATKRVLHNRIARACCVVRPPGHHALPSCAMGFCLFNHVAVAAQEARRRGWAQRVLILDWDVHHGNGTQKMFYDDESVLFFSIHRFDAGAFFPGGPDGDCSYVGEGDGRGKNINVAWPRSGAGDAEYRAVVDVLLRPIGLAFKPDIVLVSAGFDAAGGDPLGE
jgi:acetoin utilization deacetylase AcuC-like enzyme